MHVCTKTCVINYGKCLHVINYGENLHEMHVYVWHMQVQSWAYVCVIDYGECLHEMHMQVKRIHEYKRQLLNVLQVIHRYNTIKAMKPADREKVNYHISQKLHT